MPAPHLVMCIRNLKDGDRSIVTKGRTYTVSSSFDCHCMNTTYLEVDVDSPSPAGILCSGANSHMVPRYYFRDLTGPEQLIDDTEKKDTAPSSPAVPPVRIPALEEK